VTVEKLRSEWARPEVLSAAEVKRRLLCLALVRFHREVHEPQRVRFDRSWYAGAELVRPAEWLYGTGTGESNGDSFDLNGCPSVGDLNRFGRFAEQRLIGYAREELRELASEVLEDALKWSRGGSDVLDQPQSITTSLTAGMVARENVSLYHREIEPAEIDDWGDRYCDALNRLRRVLTRARIEALLSCFKVYRTRFFGQVAALNQAAFRVSCRRTSTGVR
jgi:hypothetical protein